MHLRIDEETGEARAAEVTTSNTGGAPMRPELPAQIPPRRSAKPRYPASAGASFGRSLSEIACRAMIARNQAVKALRRLGPALRRL